MKLKVTERQTLRNRGQNFDSANEKIVKFSTPLKKAIAQSTIY
jgi:hypothetical protein